MRPKNRILNKVKRQILKMNKNRLEIILYHFVSDQEDIFVNSGHNIRPNVFREQIKYLNDHFKIIPLRQIRSIFSKGKASDGPYVSICFDDGYLNNLTKAYPILKEHVVPATVFICPSVIDNQDLLWRDKVRFIIEQGMVDSFVSYLKICRNSGKYHFEGLDQNNFYKWSKDHDSITDMSIQEDLNQYFWKNDISPSQIAKKHNLFMDRSNITNFEYLDFGNHTWSHPLMTLLDYKQQKSEIIKTHEYLSDAGVRPSALAMPFSPYNQDTEKICKEIGYDCILTVNGRSNVLKQKKDDIFILHRRMAPATLTELKRII